MRQATCANLQGRKLSSHHRLWDALNRPRGKSIEFAYYFVARLRETSGTTSFLPVETAPDIQEPQDIQNPLAAVADAFRRRLARKSRALRPASIRGACAINTEKHRGSAIFPSTAIVVVI